MVVPLVLVMAAPETVFAEPPIAEAELAELRGGFSTPGGLDIAIAVQTDTRVDGSLILRTVFRANEGPATLAAYAPQTDPSAVKTPVAIVAAEGGPSVNVMFDRSNGVRFVNGGAASPSLSISTGAAEELGASPDGSAAIPLSQGGPAIDVASGSLAIRSTGSGSRVNLQGPGLDVSHVIGSAFGSVIANSANDRSIETVTSIGLDISGATVANLGSALLRVDTLTTDAAIQMMPR
jgi:hypothetical protein